MTVIEAIQSFETSGYTFTGFKDAGWGEKRYHFTHPNIHGEVIYDLSLLRKRGQMLDWQRWNVEQDNRQTEYAMNQTKDV